MKTCSKESGARLVELGVEKESHFRWLVRGEPNWKVPFLTCKTDWAYNYDFVPAFTACELGEMLPEYFNVFRCEDGMCECHSNNVLHDVEHTYADTEAEARALMLIWLLENGHIKKEEVNG